MRTLIVYESLFGNTEQLARRVAAGLTRGGASVEVAEVKGISPETLGECDLLVLGAPTHAFSLSRASTRDSAVQQGAERSHAVLGAREWLEALGRAPHEHAQPRVAVFDTRVTKVKRIPGSASRKAAKMFKEQGYTLVEKPASFFVHDVAGPIEPGELDRAEAWGTHLATLVGGHAAGAV